MVVVRGGCDFLTKAAHVAAANGTLMVMVDADAGSCVVMGTNDTAHAKVLPPGLDWNKLQLCVLLLTCALPGVCGASHETVTTHVDHGMLTTHVDHGMLTTAC